MLSFNPTRRNTEQEVDPKVQIMGVTHKGSFNCEARTFCTVGDNHVWVSERSGVISVRNARTGDIIMCVDTGVRPLFANCMREIGKHVWAGSTDGRLCIFDTNQMNLLSEIVSPEMQHPSEIFELITDGRSVFTSSASARIDEWNVETRCFVKSIIHKGPVKGLVIVGAALVSGDSTGAVVSWDISTGEKLAVSSDNSTSGVTAIIYEPLTNSVWVARENFTISVYNSKLDQIDILSDSSGKLNSFITIGGKVWGAGASKEVYVWHAYNRKLIGSFKNHNAFIFGLGKIFTSETARVWSLSNDKTVNIYDGEGFFEPVRGVTLEDEKTNALQQQIHSLVLEKTVLERRLASQAKKNTEFEKLRNTIAEQLNKIQDLENVVNIKEEYSRNQLLDYTNLSDQNQQMMKENIKLKERLRVAVEEIDNLHFDITRLQGDITRFRSNASSISAAAENEKALYEEEKNCAKALLSAKEKSLELMREDLKAARHQASEAFNEKNKNMADWFKMKKTLNEMESKTEEAVRKAANAEAALDRLNDSLMQRENDLRKAREDMIKYGKDAHTAKQELNEFKNKISGEGGKHKYYSYDDVFQQTGLGNFKNDLHSLNPQLDESVHDRETKLNLQIDELKRQLENDKSTIKALQEQYTIFQFVINSRSELVQHLWTLHNKIRDASRAVSALDVGIRNYSKTTGALDSKGNLGSQDRLTLKREWRSNVIDRSLKAITTLSDSQKQVEYVVSNYFSDYEKMHLGISINKYQPDGMRSTVIGDDLLTKLKDVTLPKQFIASGGDVHGSIISPTPNYGVNISGVLKTPSSVSIKPLPTPHYDFRPHHTMNKQFVPLA